MPGREIQRQCQHSAKRGSGRHAKRKRRCKRVSEKRLQARHPRRPAPNPTRAPASTRGSRATKKICASVLSANGTDESNTRQRSMSCRADKRRRQATRSTAPAPKSSQVAAILSADAHDGRASSAREIGITVKWPVLALVAMSTSTPYSCRMSARVEHRCRWSGCEHPASIEKNQIPAEAGREIQIVGGDDDREPADLVELGKNRADLELVGEIERRRRLVEKKDVGQGVGRGLLPRFRKAPPDSFSSCASALAMTTRCFSPPESVLKRRDCRCRVPVARNASRAMSISSGPSISNAPRCG